MSISQLRNEIDTMIDSSGFKPTMKMKCSILRALSMRHKEIDNRVTRDIIETVLKEKL
ncbi:MAG: hypothetical protein U9N52_10390 [Campylobacterota bacterium]|nr:hypothetical protein [Campylobacterota bacterium]